LNEQRRAYLRFGRVARVSSVDVRRFLPIDLALFVGVEDARSVIKGGLRRCGSIHRDYAECINARALTARLRRVPTATYSTSSGAQQSEDVAV
jgi:hypothetical protein